ncbi:hypothetical protein LCGC14_0547810 [marine sediment metagenome]|uniref:Uncharacterized protein n=1 Tax=marine sediment metagenome TaxID=412755 RepID=A0A0F9RVP0_9ZZZZ
MDEKTIIELFDFFWTVLDEEFDLNKYGKESHTNAINKLRKAVNKETVNE